MASSRDMPMPLSEIVIVPASGIEPRRECAVRVVLEQRRRSERPEAELVDCIGRVRNQLPQEDLPFEYSEWIISLQELPRLRLKSEGGAGILGLRFRPDPDRRSSGVSPGPSHNTRRGFMGTTAIAPTWDPAAEITSIR